MVGIGIIISIVIILLFIVPICIECYANLINPSPKMLERDEERMISSIKIREMYDAIKR